MYRVWRTRRAVADADVVLADSPTIASAIHERVPGVETRIIRFGVEPGEPSPLARKEWRQRLGFSDEAFVIHSSRLLRPLYNIDTIVQAMPSIRRELPTAVLILKELPDQTDQDYKNRCLELAEESQSSVSWSETNCLSCTRQPTSTYPSRARTAPRCQCSRR
jgi:hypothetical protein